MSASGGAAFSFSGSAPSTGGFAGFGGSHSTGGLAGFGGSSHSTGGFAGFGSRASSSFSSGAASHPFRFRAAGGAPPGPPPGLPGAGPMSMGLIDQLERLSALKAQGALTDEEFSLAKKKLLEEPGAAATPAPPLPQAAPRPPPPAPPLPEAAGPPRRQGPAPSEPTSYQGSLLRDAAGLWRGCVPLPFEVGASVDGKYPNGNYYAATVAEVHDGGAEYTLDWKDGDAKHKRQPSTNVRRGLTEAEQLRARERAEAEKTRREEAVATARAEAEAAMRALLEAADSDIEAVAAAASSAPPGMSEELLERVHERLRQLSEIEDLKRELERLIESSETTSGQLARAVTKAEGVAIPPEVLAAALSLIDAKKEQEQAKAAKEREERIAKMTLGDLARSTELSPERFAQKFADNAERGRADSTGRTPLHSLCQNGLATKEMILAVAEAEPSCVAAKDATGNTPLIYLLGGQQVASQSAAFDEASDGVKLIEGSKRAVSAGENSYAVVNTGFSSGRAAWEFKLIEDARDDEFSCLGAAIKPLDNPTYNRSPNLLMVECYNGKLHWGDNANRLKEKITKIHEGDLVRVELDMEKGELTYKVNGEDQGVCFNNIASGTTVYPAVCWCVSCFRCICIRCTGST